MVWRFHGSATAKTFYPLSRRQFIIDVDQFSTTELVSIGLSGLIATARKSIEIMPRDRALEILQNDPEKSANALSLATSALDFGYLSYHHQPAGNDHYFALVVGLDDIGWSACEPDLDSALLRAAQVSVTCSGGFSAVSPNPYSKQPTTEEFETGHPMVVDNIRMTILHRGDES